MSLFEVALLFFFVVLPLLEGYMRKRKGDAPDPPPPPRPSRRPPGTGRVERSDRSTGARQAPGAAGQGGGARPAGEPTSAADMVPDDLWQILTGESRPGGATTTAEPEPDREEEGWWVSEESGSEWDRDIGSGEDVADSEISAPWDEPADEPPATITEARYEVGPEEYPEARVVSLETPPPSAEKRHSRFHDRIDAMKAADRQRALPVERTALSKALRSPSGLRQAVLMKEILGPPKGLE